MKLLSKSFLQFLLKLFFLFLFLFMGSNNSKLSAWNSFTYDPTKYDENTTIYISPGGSRTIYFRYYDDNNYSKQSDNTKSISASFDLELPNGISCGGSTGTKHVTYSGGNSIPLTFRASSDVVEQNGGVPGVTINVKNVIVNGNNVTNVSTIAFHISESTVNPTSVSLDKTSLGLAVGEYYYLTATVYPSNATNKSVTYSTSNSSVATVSSIGKVTAVKTGTATITAKTSNNKTATCSVTVSSSTVYPTSVTLDKTSLGLAVGEYYYLTATVYPSNATDKSVTYSTSNSSVATVNSSGKVSAVGTGSATITAKTSNNKTATCSVTVGSVYPTSISLSPTNLEMAVGETSYLIAVVYPIDATDRKVTFSSSNSSVATVATVDKNSNTNVSVTAVGPGSATITAKTSNNKTATCSVTVSNSTVYPTSISLNKTSLGLTVGEYYYLTATISPSYATDKTVTYSTSNSNVATVDSSGKVTAVGIGSATITAKTSNNKTATCYVTVISDSEPNVKGKTFCLCCARGYVTSDGTKLYGTSSYWEASEFAIIEYNSQTYLYDVYNNTFVVHTTAAKAGTNGNNALENDTDLTKAVTGLHWGKTNIEEYPWYLEDSFGNWLNMDGAQNVYMNTWKNFENGEGGNTYKVEIADDYFDDTYAIQILYDYFHPDEEVLSSDISLTSDKIGLYNAGDEAEINILLSPSNATNKNLTYKVSNSSIITVSNPYTKEGNSGIFYKLKAVDRGVSTIIFTTTDGTNLSDTCKVASYWANTISSANSAHYTKNPVQSLSDLENNRVYTATTARGSWLVLPGDTELATTRNFGNETIENTDNILSFQEPAQQFAFINCDGNYYIYSVGEKKILNGITTNKPNGGILVTEDCQSVNITETGDSGYPLFFSFDNSFNINIDKSGKVFIDGWTTKDEGNKVALQIVDDVTISDTELYQIYDMVGYEATIIATGISLNETNVVLTGKGQNLQLTATVTPNNATDRSVTWTSSNTTVATVSNTGLVTTISPGTTVITASTSNNKTATCYVTVEEPIIYPTSVSLNESSKTVYVGDSFQLTATVSPSNATDKTVTYSTSNSSVATVNSSGKVTAVGTGSATITAKTSNNKTATCYVTVENPALPEQPTDEGYQAALNSINTNAKYGIYTEFNDVRYYLTNDGYLTEQPTQNCIFTFYRTEGSSLFRSPGWKLDACFSNPKLSNNGGASGDLLPQGHLLTDKQNRDDWEGQVWYLGSNGFYAVRATNSTGTAWGANTFWTVLDTDGNGQPEADYSFDATFIWNVDKDIISVDIVNTIIDNKKDVFMFDLSGRRVSTTRPSQKGVYIRNGHKFIY